MYISIERRTSFLILLPTLHDGLIRPFQSVDHRRKLWTIIRRHSILSFLFSYLHHKHEFRPPIQQSDRKRPLTKPLASRLVSARWEESARWPNHSRSLYRAFSTNHVKSRNWLAVRPGETPHRSCRLICQQSLSSWFTSGARSSISPSRPRVLHLHQEWSWMSNSSPRPISKVLPKSFWKQDRHPSICCVPFALKEGRTKWSSIWSFQAINPFASRPSPQTIPTDVPHSSVYIFPDIFNLVQTLIQKPSHPWIPLVPK